MIDVYFVEPSREEIAADRRAALWGRFERASKANFVPPELRIKPVASPTEHRTAKVKGKARSSIGRMGNTWYADALKEAIKSPIIYGQTPAANRMRQMKPGETVVFRTIDLQAGKQLRAGLDGLVWPKLDKERSFMISGSRELVRVVCSTKNTVTEAGI